MSGASKENVETTYLTRTDTEVTFELPPVYAGGHYAYLHVPDMGFSSINITLTTTSSVLGLFPSIGYE
jgi:hypothetical protein